MPYDYLTEWNLSPDEINEILSVNPSLRGITFGYVAEYKLRKIWFSSSHFSQVQKYDDHDRKKKGDLSFIYRGHEIKVESKSLQTNSIKETSGIFSGTIQCDASDKRPIALPNGNTVSTTCLLVGEFDLLAANLFNFKKEWLFGFALNEQLPRSRFKNYNEEDAKYLLATSIKVDFPLQAPFHYEPFTLLDQIIAKKEAGIK